MAKAQEGLEGLTMKWNVSVLRRSGECERTEVADFELSEFFNRIASVEGKAWVLSVERVMTASPEFFDVQALISSQSVSCAPLRLNHSPRSPLKVRESRTISTDSVFLFTPL